MTVLEFFLLHARADRVLRTTVSNRLEPYKLTMMEWLLLGVVCAGPEDGMSMSAVARTLDVTLPQVTALANKLLNLKLIKQKTHAQDRRSRRVIPTAKGRLVLEDIAQSVGKAMETWLADLPESQTESYFATLQWVVNHKYSEDSDKNVTTVEGAKDKRLASDKDSDQAQKEEYQENNQTQYGVD